MTAAIKLGYVGLGYWGTRLARASLRTGEVTIVGGFARSPAARARFAQEFGGESFDSVAALLEADVDGVVIATPIATHAELVIQVAEAGKHVFVEKPLTLEVKSAQEAILAAERADVVLQVGHHRRYLAATRRLGELVLAGHLGTLYAMEATIINSDGLHPSNSWKFDPDQRPLGAMTQQGVHMIDNMHYIAGPAKRVSALSKRVVPWGTSEDTTALIIEYKSGPIGVILNAAIGTWVASFGAHGTGGSAWSVDDGARFYRQDIEDRTRIEVPVQEVDAVADQLVEFARCVRSGNRPEVDGHAAMEVVVVMQAGLLSVKRRAAVDVDEVRSELSFGPGS